MGARQDGRTPPPGVRAQKTALLIARWLALVVIIVAIVIAVTSCSSRPEAGQAPPSDPHAGSGSTGASAQPTVQPTAGPAADAVAAGIERAASYNFTLSAVASEADLQALRAAPQDTLQGATVAPAACRDAVRDLNWSPASLGQDAARTDFAADGVDATGSVEVARVTGRPALEGHYATVQRMLGECSDVTLSISGTDVPLRSTAPSAGHAASALLWSRAGQDSDLRQQALVLIGERKGYVAMVSFIGTSGLDDAKFAGMADGILAATLKDLA